MRLGAPRDEDDPEPTSLVRSAADKARAKAEGGAAAVLSLGAGAPPLAGTYRKHEILTGKLSPALRKRLADLEFDAKEPSAPGLTQIRLPPLREAWETLRGLAEEFPTQGFALNYIHRPIRYVVDDAPKVVAMSKTPSVGCTTERCYGRRLIGWQEHLSACAKGVKVGIIDTGFDVGHPAFAGVKATVVMRPEDDAAKAKDWHGTAVFALLAGAAKSSTPGFIPEADFLVADAFFDVGGQPQTDTAHLLEALEQLQKHGAQIINISIVGPPDDLLRDRIAYMSRRKGVVFVAAAGNGGQNAAPGYPAAYPEVIAVTAVDSNAKGYRNANRGDYINVAAPGVHVWTAWPGHKEAMVTGTSFAAPFVTALAAVTYNNSQLKASIDTKRSSLAPKKMTLAGFFIDKVANGEDREQRRTFGEGLIKAPRDCMPNQRPQPWLATVMPRLAAPTIWPAAVKAASFP